MTHPFHPWFGCEFGFIAIQQTWRQDRVFFFGGDGSTLSLPRAWTDLADPDVFVTIAAGRSAFRVAELLALAELIDGVRAPGV